MKVVIAAAGRAAMCSRRSRSRIGSPATTERTCGSSVSPNGQEATYIPEAGYPFHAVEALPLYREVSWRAAKAPLVALRSMVRCAPWVKGADVAVGLGGYVSVPPMLAARRAHVRSVLHEPNAVPGSGHARARPVRHAPSPSPSRTPAAACRVTPGSR